MRLARRYLATEIYRSSAIVLLALMGLFSFFNLIDELDKLSAEFTLKNLLYLQALALPTQLYELLPIGLLIGAVLALAGLAQRNELVVLRAAGVSGLQLLFSLWLATLPLVIGAFVLSEYITPRAEIQFSESSLQFLGKAGGGRLNSGYWFKEHLDNDHTRIINIASLRGTQSVEGIIIYELDPQQQLHSYIRASHGDFVDHQLRLQHAEQTDIAPQARSALANASIPTEPIIQVHYYGQLALDTHLNASRLMVRVLTPERMAISDLVDYIAYLDANQQQSERQSVALWRKMAYPFSLFIMVTIAAPISFMQTRRGGMGTKVFIGILIGVGFFMVNQLALNLGMLTQWAPWVTALLPSLFALILALLVLLIIENRHRWAHFFRKT